MAYQLQWALITALFLSTASFSACASMDLAKIHEHMTEDELSATFNVKDKAAVPDYEVVPIFHQPNQSHRNRRSLPAGHHVVNVKDRTLYLEPVDHVLLGQYTPVYLASGNKSHPHGIRYEQIENAWPKSLSMYQDPDNNAAVVVIQDFIREMNLEGFIGDNMVIKPVPSRFQDLTSPNSHILYKNDFAETAFSPDSFFDKSYWSKKPQPDVSMSERDTAYVEILVIADYTTYLSHDKNLRALCKYMAIFWNAVDLRFRKLTNPKVRLNIAGLIVATDEDAVPYLTMQRTGKNYLRSWTFADMSTYLYNEERFGKDTYDVAIAITDLDLCSYRENVTDCDPSTLGVSRTGGACMHNSHPLYYGVSVIEDHSDIDGIFVAAHEIGHLLGVYHDALGGKFGDCNPKNGFLMASGIDASTNAFIWSECSMREMSQFLKQKSAECLYNKPVVKKPLAKILPGQVTSRDEQCSFHDGMIACNDEREDECRMLYCRKPGNWLEHHCVMTDRPSEGSSCSDGGMCLDGVCIHDENNEMTDLLLLNERKKYHQ